MIYTNKFDMPNIFIKALQKDDYVGGGDISATSLIKAPRIRQLEIRHDDEIVTDWASRFYMFLGKIGHKVLEETDEFETFKEERLSVMVRGWEVSGQTDMFQARADGRHIVADFKVTSAFTAAFGLKTDWEQQLNIYGALWREHGYPVDELQIIAIYRDWRETDGLKRRDYPPPAQIIQVPMWEHDMTMAWIGERVALHQESELLPDNDLPRCTPEEQWRKDPKFAVMKKGRKTALKLFDEAGPAWGMAKGLGAGHYVEDRPAIPTRCERFCGGRDFCNQYKEEQTSNGEEQGNDQ